MRYKPNYFKDYMDGEKTTVVDPRFRPLIRQFFFDSDTRSVPFGKGIRPEIPLICPTSVCSWRPYTTLGACSSCVEIENLLEFVCLNARVDWSATQFGTLKKSYFNATMCGVFMNITMDSPIPMFKCLMNNKTDHTKREALLVRNMPLTDQSLEEPVHGGSIMFKQRQNRILDALIVSAKDGAESLYNHTKPVVNECVRLATAMSNTIRSSTSNEMV